MPLNSDKREFPSKKPRSGVSSLFVLAKPLWLLATFVQSDAEIFLAVGLLSLVFTLIARLIATRKKEIDVSGGILGFILAWVIAYYFYESKSAMISAFNWELQVEEVMIGFLFVLFAGWILIKEQIGTQELVFGLSPFISAMLLNLWQIAVLVELLTLLDEFEFLRPFATFFFLLVGFFDLILLLTRRKNLNYTELILNPVQLLGAMFAGSLQAGKWILLISIFVVLDHLSLGLGPWTLIVSALGVALFCFSESLTRTTLASGVIESRVEQGKTIVPMIFEEIREFDAKDFQIYETQSLIEIRKRGSIKKFPSKTLLLRLPFSPELEEQGGIFVTQIELSRATTKNGKHELNLQRGLLVTPIESSRVPTACEKPVAFVTPKEHKGKSGLNLHTQGLFRIEVQEWKRIQPGLLLRETVDIASELGLENTEAIDELFHHTVQGTILAQKNVHNRLRGLPAPVKTKPFSGTIKNGALLLPKELLQAKDIQEETEIDIIPGKGEFLFYGRARKK
ncbi:MAG: hypothetical protein ACE5OZ_21235 [Candidatus Heimdallarchaeota archaeon]